MSGYTPAFNTIFTGTLHGQWPDVGLWLCVLALSDKHGHVDCTPQYIASVTGLAVTAVTECIERFMQPDPHSRTQTQEGRRLELIDPNRPWGWKIVNHGKYREKARKQNYDDKRTESGDDADRKRAERDKSRAVPTRPDASRAVPLSDANTNTNTKKNSVRAASLPTDGTDADQIWSLGVQILGESSRSLLGRMVKQYGRETVASKIGELSAIQPRPVDPKSWLIGALRPREERADRFKTA